MWEAIDLVDFYSKFVKTVSYVDVALVIKGAMPSLDSALTS